MNIIYDKLSSYEFAKLVIIRFFNSTDTVICSEDK